MTAPTQPYVQGYPPAQQPYPSQPYQQPYPPQPYQQPFPQAQGYPAPQMAPPQQPLAKGSIDDFFNQPSGGGGKSLSFKVVGTRYIGVVSRALTNGDIRQQTDVNGLPQFFRDGRPKFVMTVPLQMQPTPEYPDGVATWFVKGQARDELARAMAEAGAPAGPPEPGAVIDISYVADRPGRPGFNPAKQMQIHYTRPQGDQVSAPQAPASAAQPQAAQVGVALPVAPPQAAVPYPPQQQPLPPQQPQAAPTGMPAQPQPPADLSEEQQRLLARLTGG